MFFGQEGLPFRSRNHLSLNQLLDGKNPLLPMSLFRFEKPVQPLPQIPPSLTLPLEGGGMGGGEFGNRSKTVESFFEIHRKLLKFEIRISKLETNPKFQTQYSKPLVCLGHLYSEH